MKIYYGSDDKTLQSQKRALAIGVFDGVHLGHQKILSHMIHDAKKHGIELSVVKLPEAKRGFVLLPRRWVVERSFAWAARFRRLAKDYERLRSRLFRLSYVKYTNSAIWDTTMREYVIGNFGFFNLAALSRLAGAAEL